MCGSFTFIFSHPLQATRDVCPEWAATHASSRGSQLVTKVDSKPQHVTANHTDRNLLFFHGVTTLNGLKTLKAVTLKGLAGGVRKGSEVGWGWGCGWWDSIKAAEIGRIPDSQQMPFPQKDAPSQQSSQIIMKVWMFHLFSSGVRYWLCQLMVLTRTSVGVDGGRTVFAVDEY